MPKISMADRRNAEQKLKPEKIPGPTSVRFTKEEYEEIQATAWRLGVTLSDLIRWRNAYARGINIETYVEPTHKNKLRMP